MIDQRTMKAKKTSVDGDAAASEPRAHILVVEDEADLQELLRYNLEREGYRVTSVMRGKLALEAAASDPPSLILLDLMLPGMDGLEVCRALRGSRETGSIPVVMLTAKGEESDIVAGLELGADDYITKPFSPRVLLARVKAVLRRGGMPTGPAEEEVLTVGELAVDPVRHEARVAGEAATLTQSEFKILHLLAARPGRVFTRAQIVQYAQGDHVAVTDRSVDVHIVALRRKLGTAGSYIQTVRGVGYRIEDK